MTLPNGSRISSAFLNDRRPLLVACTVAGDPDFHESIRIAQMLVAAGADVLELVMPFSDPVADGPIIQQAGLRALSAGMNTDLLFELVREVRKETMIPLLIMTYANIVIQRGIEKFYHDAARAGADGVVVADVPIEEAAPFSDAARMAKIDPILFVSQTTSPTRMEKILGSAGGFVYVVAAMGVTGIRDGIAPETISCIQNIKKKTTLPVVPGFGISTSEHIKTYAQAGADGVIVGSAIVRLVGEYSGNPDAMEKAIRTLVHELKAMGVTS
ncbi:MAG: tryptophan synthase subunit alpha [Methanoregulaceae archaeon]|nr:tryptophan synthase subunit alpha [Methanoregulaceae archaeon]